MQVVDSEGYLKVKLVGGPVGPFVPYTGATANVDLGEYEIKAGQFTLDTSPTGTAVVGTTRWNDAIGSSETTLKGGSVILKNGVDLVARVVNKVTPNTTLTKAGYAAVRVSGAQGQRLAVAYAQANDDNNSADTIGLVTETIATNQEGFIMTVGQLEGINTTGSLQGETWVDGNVLYLSPTIPGALTNIKPNGLTGHIVVMGYVEYAHAINGKIYVKIMNGWELDELHNVYINPATIANNNILQYDSADQLWKNQVLNTGITIGTTAITSGTVGRVLFEGTGNVVQESANLTYDNTNLIFTLGSTATRILTFRPQDTTGAYGNSCSIRGGNGNGRLDFYSGSNITELRDNIIILTSVGGPSVQVGVSSISLSVGGSTRLQVAPTTGNVLINTTTDAGFRLDVNGTARVQGNVTFSTNLSIGTTATPNKLTVYGDAINIKRNGAALNVGLLISDDTKNWQFIANRVTNSLNIYDDTLGANRFIISSVGNVLINTTTDAGFRLDVNGTARVSGNTTIVGNITQSGANTTNLGYITNATLGVYGNTPAASTIGLLVGCVANGGHTAIFTKGNNSGSTAIRITDQNVGASINHFLVDFAGASGFGIANGTTVVNASAQVEIQSTTKGFLPPRMTTTQRNAIASPATGLQVFDTTLNRPCFYDGTTWITL